MIWMALIWCLFGWMVYDLWDCVATIPPYPHYIGERDDGQDVASAISNPDSIFFRCTLRPSPNIGRQFGPTMQPRVATTVIRKTIMSTCFSSFERHWWQFDVDPFFRRRELGIAQEQPCIWDQHLPVELWQAPSSCWGTFGRQNRKHPQAFQVRNVPARLDMTSSLWIPKNTTNSIVIWMAKSIIFSCLIHFPPF